MIVWGGENYTSVFRDGATYDPAANTWAIMPISGAPSARAGQTTIWTGDRMIVWGGSSTAGLPNESALGNGAAFLPDANSWSTISKNGAPTPRYWTASVWTGSEMLVWGGEDATFLSDGARYNPSGSVPTTTASATPTITSTPTVTPTVTPT
jgi:hypothetical protein